MLKKFYKEYCFLGGNFVRLVKIYQPTAPTCNVTGQMHYAVIMSHCHYLRSTYFEWIRLVVDPNSKPNMKLICSHTFFIAIKNVMKSWIYIKRPVHANFRYSALNGDAIHVISNLCNHIQVRNHMDNKRIVTSYRILRWCN